MSRTESTMVQLGTTAPAFELTDVLTGRAMSRDDVFALSWDDNLSDAANTAVTGGPAQKHGLLVMFLCVHCPFVIHVEQEIANIARDYAGKIAFCAIMSNDVAAYPDDSRPRRGDSGNDTPVTGRDLRSALDAVIAGKRPDPNQRASIGCNIKWRES